MPLTSLYCRVIPIAVVLLVSLVWLPLAFRYRPRRAVLGALVVTACSASIPPLLAYYLEARRNADPLVGVTGEWPSIIVAAGVAVLCDLFMPMICFSIVFSVATLFSAGTLELWRHIESERRDRDIEIHCPR
jgi:hypothetical protein